MRHSDLVSLSLLLGALLVGVGGQKKINECNSLIQVINAGVTSMQKGTKVQGDEHGTTELTLLADAMDKVATDASKVELSIPELQKYSTEYQTMARQIAKSARQMATDFKDSAKLAAAQAELDKAAKQEDPLVASINKFCEAP
jgi:hypothetical protein